MPIFTSEAQTSFNYILLPPKTVKEGETYPLIVCLHGAGERGTDTELLYVHGIPKYVRQGLDIPAFILAPQCPNGFCWNSFPIQVKELIDKTVAQNPIDPDRITATGLSMGGFGSWDLAVTYPDFFAGIAPICGGGLSWRCSALKNRPIWAFHGDSDTVVPPKNSIEMVDAVKAAGGNPKLTLFHNVGHNAWEPAYEDTKLINWLLAQKR